MPAQGHTSVQGYLARKKIPHPRTLQQAYAYEPVIVLGGGRFLMSEVPLYVVPSQGTRE